MIVVVADAVVAAAIAAVAVAEAAAAASRRPMGHASRHQFDSNDRASNAHVQHCHIVIAT